MDNVGNSAIRNRKVTLASIDLRRISIICSLCNVNSNKNLNKYFSQFYQLMLIYIFQAGTQCSTTKTNNNIIRHIKTRYTIDMNKH